MQRRVRKTALLIKGAGVSSICLLVVQEKRTRGKRRVIPGEEKAREKLWKIPTVPTLTNERRMHPSVRLEKGKREGKERERGFELLVISEGSQGLEKRKGEKNKIRRDLWVDRFLCPTDVSGRDGESGALVKRRGEKKTGTCITSGESRRG